MKMNFYKLQMAAVIVLLMVIKQSPVLAQSFGHHWTADGYHYYSTQGGQISEIDARDGSNKVIVSKDMLTPAGKASIGVRRFSLSNDGQKVLINTNTKRVWRFDTRGDYWVYDLAAKTLTQIGKDRPASSLMFAKFSPDGSKVAYGSEHNIFVETLSTGAVKQLTTDGTRKLINGTFDWVYEEELNCRDGFRWSPDGKSIAYWQIDASKIKDYLMLNTTDTEYPQAIPVEYPVAGEDPSACKVGVVSADGGKTTWLNIPGDAVQHYIPRMEWANADEVILQQLNRAQTESIVYIANYKTGAVKPIMDEKDNAWIDVKSEWNGGNPFASDPTGWDWMDKGKAFLWGSEKDGWRHFYTVWVWMAKKRC